MAAATGGYHNRPVLVVGGLGFIGSNLTAHLRRLGARVTIVTRSLDAHREVLAEHEARGVRMLEGDLRDLGAMTSAVNGQEIVFNLAGQSGAVRSMQDPWTDLDVNVRGNLVLLEALRETNCRAKLVFVGSRLEYGRVGAAPVAEDHPIDPLCLHAVHKFAVEQYVRIYEQLFGLRVAVARVTNPYGPGQPWSRAAYGVVNHMIQQAVMGETLRVYGDGQQRRDYIYIDDLSAALARLGESAASDGRVYNVGTGMGTRVVEMVRAIAELAGRARIEFVEWPPLAERIETGDFVADISRISSELGWTPEMPLADGLRQTVAFYKSHLAAVKVEAEGL